MQARDRLIQFNLQRRQERGSLLPRARARFLSQLIGITLLSVADRWCNWRDILQFYMLIQLVICFEKWVMPISLCTCRRSLSRPGVASRPLLCLPGVSPHPTFASIWGSRGTASFVLFFPVERRTVDTYKFYISRRFTSAPWWVLVLLACNLSRSWFSNFADSLHEISSSDSICTFFPGVTLARQLRRSNFFSIVRSSFCKSAILNANFVFIFISREKCFVKCLRWYFYSLLQLI